MRISKVKFRMPNLRTTNKRAKRVEESNSDVVQKRRAFKARKKAKFKDRMGV